MRDVAIVAFAQTDHRRRTDDLSEVEMLMPVLHQVLDATGLRARDIGFTCSGSSDYLAGRAFSFTMALDGVGAQPPISESHVEMDGAWALYEAWVKLRTGEADTALVYAYGKSSPGEVRDVLTRQLDPYYVGPLWPDSVALAALQAQALIDAGETDEAALASIAARNRTAAAHNPHAQLAGSVPVSTTMSSSRCAPVTARRSATAPQPWFSPPVTPRALCAPARPGSAASTTASRPTVSGCGSSPTRRRPGSPPNGPGPSNGPSTPRSCMPRSPPRRSFCAGRSGSTTASASTRPAVRSPPTPSWPPD